MFKVVQFIINQGNTQGDFPPGEQHPSNIYYIIYNKTNQHTDDVPIKYKQTVKTLEQGHMKNHIGRAPTMLRKCPTTWVVARKGCFDQGLIYDAFEGFCKGCFSGTILDQHHCA